MGDEHALEFLLAFDGRIHYLEGGYWLQFQVKRVKPTDARPHGVAYSFSLHDPSGFRGVEKLIDDFFDEVERVLADRGIKSRVVATKTSRNCT